jgi:hypothetical protein
MLDIKVRKKLFVIGVIVFTYVLILTVGYAFFNESLTINGVASTVDYYEGEKLPVAAVIRDTSNNRYYTANGTKPFVDFDSETWQDDTYQLNFEKKVGVVAGSRTITYVVTFTNPTTTSFSNGTINTEIIENYNSRLKSVSGSLSKTEVAPGESVDVMFTVEFNFLTELGEHIAKATISYTYQNKPRYFYFIIRYFNQ